MLLLALNKMDEFLDRKSTAAGKKKVERAKKDHCWRALKEQFGDLPPLSIFCWGSFSQKPQIIDERDTLAGPNHKITISLLCNKYRISKYDFRPYTMNA